MRTWLIPPRNGGCGVWRDQATFRPTPEVVSAFASAWRVLSILVRALPGITIVDTRRLVPLATNFSGAVVRHVPNGWLGVACTPVLLKCMVLQAQAQRIQRVTPVRRTWLVYASVTTTGANFRDFDNFAHDLRHGSSAGPAHPKRDGGKKKALQVATGVAGTLTR